MKEWVERIVIRWAFRRFQLLDPSSMNYGQLSKYGVEDIMQTMEGENAYVLSHPRGRLR